METHHDVLNVAQIRLRLTQGVRRGSLDVLLHQRLQLRLKVVLQAVRFGRVDLGRGEAGAELRKCASGGERSETRPRANKESMEVSPHLSLDVGQECERHPSTSSRVREPGSQSLANATIQDRRGETWRVDAPSDRLVRHDEVHYTSLAHV